MCVVKYAYKICKFYSKYLYMIHIKNRIKTQSNTTYEEPYATISEPTNATFIPTQTLEINQEEACLRQASQDVLAEPGLAQDTETEGS